VRNSRRFCVALVCAGLFAISNPAFAQLVGDPRSVDPPEGIETPPTIPDMWLGGACRSLAAERDRTVPDILDPAFDVYIRPAMLGRAYAGVDPALLTDAALQLAEGERVLLRSRKGITAAQALQLAVRAAGDKQDKASLERLAKHAESRGDKELASKIAATQKLASASRESPSRMMVPIDDIGLGAYGRIRYCIQKIDQAKLIGDARCLKAIEDDLDGCIPSRFQSDVRKLIADARASIPDDLKIDDQLVGVLSRLAATSRSDENENDKADEPVPVTGAF